MTTDASKGTRDAPGQGVKLIRWLVAFNLGLVALQAVSAGLLMSGHSRALAAHRIAAVALQCGALIQAVAAVVLWRRRRVPASVAGVGIGLLAIVFLQTGLGYRRSYWLHVPIGVGIFGGLTRQASRLDTLRRTTGARS
jgi:hypothetical protein